eukprot:1480340-Pleurochrysis_carterae.AAC.1
MIHTRLPAAIIIEVTAAIAVSDVKRAAVAAAVAAAVSAAVFTQAGSTSSLLKTTRIQHGDRGPRGWPHRLEPPRARAERVGADWQRLCHRVGREHCDPQRLLEPRAERWRERGGAVPHESEAVCRHRALAFQQRLGVTQHFQMDRRHCRVPISRRLRDRAAIIYATCAITHAIACPRRRRRTRHRVVPFGRHRRHVHGRHPLRGHRVRRCGVARLVGCTRCDRVEEAFGVELAFALHAAAADGGGEDVDRDAVQVEERHHVESDARPLQPQRARDAQRANAEMTVRQRHQLRTARRAARVQQECR